MRDSIRKRDWRESSHSRHEDIAPLRDPCCSPEALTLASELRAAIHTALTERQAEILEMRLAGHTQVEVAMQIGVSQFTVHDDERKAHAQLRKKLRPAA